MLIDAPKQFIEGIRECINITKHERFSNTCSFQTLLEMQRPTGAKVANCLKYDEDLTNDQTTTLHYLKMYIRCLGEDVIGHFVFLVTGSYQMPDAIHVQFTYLVGLAQRPTFSTCTNTIYVPYTHYLSTVEKGF